VTATRTPVCELLGIEQPIVLAPMVAVPRLAAAVSNAGALGMLTLTWSDDVGAVVRETAALTARPFCGNLVLTEDRHRRLDQALDAGLRIVSFSPARTPDPAIARHRSRRSATAPRGGHTLPG
jgi:nitronate monooxygenase